MTRAEVRRELRAIVREEKRALRDQMHWTIALVVSELLRGAAEAEADPRVARRLREVAAEIMDDWGMEPDR